MILCEICNAPATIAYTLVDEEGDSYTTERCDDHPETDPEYKEKEL